MTTKIELQAHWGNVQTRRRGCQSMQVYYVDDKPVGTTMKEVKAALPSDMTWAFVRQACNDAKDYGNDGWILEQKDGKWTNRIYDWDKDSPNSPLNNGE